MARCPECDHDGGFEDCGPYQVMCLSCGALVMRSEVGEDFEEAEEAGGAR